MIKAMKIFCFCHQTRVTASPGPTPGLGYTGDGPGWAVRLSVAQCHRVQTRSSRSGFAYLHGAGFNHMGPLRTRQLTFPWGALPLKPHIYTGWKHRARILEQESRWRCSWLCHSARSDSGQDRACFFSVDKASVLPRSFEE